jgi:hypothetical protein
MVIVIIMAIAAVVADRIDGVGGVVTIGAINYITIDDILIFIFVFII